MVLPFFVGFYAYVGSWLSWWWVWVHCGFMVVAVDFGIGFDFFLVSVHLQVHGGGEGGLPWWWQWILGWVLPFGFRFCGFLL